VAAVVGLDDIAGCRWLWGLRAHADRRAYPNSGKMI
jgi:hypothetical protein